MKYEDNIINEEKLKSFIDNKETFFLICINKDTVYEDVDKYFNSYEIARTMIYKKIVLEIHSDYLYEIENSDYFKSKLMVNLPALIFYEKGEMDFIMSLEDIKDTFIPKAR